MIKIILIIIFIGELVKRRYFCVRLSALFISLTFENYERYFFLRFNMYFVLAIRGRLKIDPCNR